MLLGENSNQRTHYDILSVSEDASCEEIRSSYRSAVLNSHPDKLKRASGTSNPDNGSWDRFLKVQKAWEILSDPKSRAAYDKELQASRQDAGIAEDISLQDMMMEGCSEALDLFYQCRCGDYFSVDSLDLGEMGYSLENIEGTISFRSSQNALPASILLPCASCSLKIRLIIDVNSGVPS